MTGASTHHVMSVMHHVTGSPASLENEKDLTWHPLMDVCASDLFYPLTKPFSWKQIAHLALPKKRLSPEETHVT